MSLPALADFSNVAGGFSFYCLQIPELFQEDFSKQRVESFPSQQNFQ
jgi:hypothetical protein